MRSLAHRAIHLPPELWSSLVTSAALEELTARQIVPIAGLLVFSVVLSEGRARADEARGDDVIVRGTQAGGFVSRAGVEDAPREVTDAASLVEPLPGVHVRRLGADDSFATMSIRGSTSSQVAVVLAGVPLTGGADPSLDLATLPLWPGARARVYRSFAPATLGQGSLGGTLSLDPPRATDRPGTEVWAGAGSFGARRMRAGDVRQIDERGTRVATALSASRSDDDFSYYDPTSSTFRTRQNAGHADVNALVSLAMPVRYGSGEEGTLTVTALAQARHQELPGTVLAPTPFSTLDSSRELTAVELTRPAGTGAWIVRGWSRRDDLRLRNESTSFVLGPTHTNDAIVAAGAAAGWRGRVGSGLHVDTRVEGSGERFLPGQYEGAAQPPGATRALGAAAMDATFSPARRWTLAGAGRLDVWSDRSDGGTTATEVHPTGHVGGEVLLGPVALATHAGVVARPASFVERYGNRGGILGDPNLKTETASTVDAGARYAHRFRDLFLSAELDGFATWATDLILLVRDSAYGQVKATNIGHARIFGSEAELLARALGVELRVAYTALLTFNDAECAGAASCDPPPLPGRPANDLVLDASYTLGPVRARYGLDVVSGMRFDPLGSIPIPARALHSLGLRLDVPGAPGLRLAVDVRNLLDLRVASYPGQLGPTLLPIGDLYDYPLPGRSVLVTARWAFPD